MKPKLFNSYQINANNKITKKIKTKKTKNPQIAKSILEKMYLYQLWQS